MFFLPLPKHEGGIFLDARLCAQAFVRSIRAWLRIEGFSSTLDELNCLGVIVELAEGRRGDAGLLKDLHSLGAVELPRGALGRAADDEHPFSLPPGSFSEVGPIGLKDDDVSPPKPGMEVWHKINQALADWPRPRVVLTDEELDLMAGLLRPESKV